MSKVAGTFRDEVDPKSDQFPIYARRVQKPGAQTAVDRIDGVKFGPITAQNMWLYKDLIGKQG